MGPNLLCDPGKKCEGDSDELILYSQEGPTVEPCFVLMCRNPYRWLNIKMLM